MLYDQKKTQSLVAILICTLQIFALASETQKDKDVLAIQQTANGSQKLATKQIQADKIQMSDSNLGNEKKIDKVQAQVKPAKVKPVEVKKAQATSTILPAAKGPGKGKIASKEILNNNKVITAASQAPDKKPASLLKATAATNSAKLANKLQSSSAVPVIANGKVQDSNKVAQKTPQQGSKQGNQIVQNSKGPVKSTGKNENDLVKGLVPPLLPENQQPRKRYNWEHGDERVKHQFGHEFEGASAQGHIHHFPGDKLAHRLKPSIQPTDDQLVIDLNHEGYMTESIRCVGQSCFTQQMPPQVPPQTLSAFTGLAPISTPLNATPISAAGTTSTSARTSHFTQIVSKPTHSIGNPQETQSIQNYLESSADPLAFLFSILLFAVLL